MAALLVRMAQLVQHPLRRDHDAPISPAELRRVALLYRQLGDFAASAMLFEQLLNDHAAPAGLEDHLALGLCYKSQRRYDEANHLWQKIVAELSFHPLPYIELAKHYEHRERAAGLALEWVERGLKNLQLCEAIGRRHEWTAYKKDLVHRQRRLQRKS